MSDIPREDAPAEEADLGPIDEEAIEDEGSDAGSEAGEDAPDSDDGGDGEEAEEEAVDEPAPRRGGGSPTVRAQRRRAQEAEQRAAALERELQEQRSQLQQISQRLASDPAAAQRAEQEWQQRLEMMTPAEAAQAVMARGRQEFGAAFQQLQFQQNDRLDKQAYDAAARTDPVFKKYQPEVERILAAERAQGRNPDRETILDVLYGREMRQRAAKAAPAQRAAAARRVAGQQGRPTGSRGNVAPRGRPAPGSPEHDDALVNEYFAKGGRL